MAQGSWRWGILGAGAAANGMAAALQAVNGGIQAIASRREETARTLAGRYGIDRVHASPEAMLQDPDLDVIYIASPHDSHHAWMKAAVQAGKHVLCEKAITLNARQLAEVVLLARAQGVVVAEAMMAAGLAPRACSCGRAVTWSRSASYIHKVVPSATMVCVKGF